MPEETVIYLEDLNESELGEPMDFFTQEDLMMQELDVEDAIYSVRTAY